jgi:hypothetical protein
LRGDGETEKEEEEESEVEGEDEGEQHTMLKRRGMWGRCQSFHRLSATKTLRCEVYWEGQRRWYMATVKDFVEDVGNRWAVLVDYQQGSAGVTTHTYHFWMAGATPRVDLLSLVQLRAAACPRQ